jgi:FtsH-binding integral membrane protein
MYENTNKEAYTYTLPQEYDAGLRKFMIGVFNNMAIGLFVSAIISWFIGNSPELLSLFFNGPQKWFFIFAPLGISLLLSFAINSISPTTARFLFYTYSVMLGVSLSILFAVFQLGSIVSAFLSTSILFLTMSIWGYTTNRDLTKMGTFLMVGAIAVVLASIFNIFIGSSALAFAVSVIAVIVFTGLTAFDVQNLKNVYWELSGDDRDKAGVLGALSLYINFVNIFVSLLQLFGERKE